MSRWFWFSITAKLIQASTLAVLFLASPELEGAGGGGGAEGSTRFDSLAFIPDRSTSGPQVSVAGHPGLNWTRVRFEPRRTNGFPEELHETASFAAPARGVSGLAYGAGTLWVASSETKRIYRVDRNNGTVVKSFAAIGDRPAGLAWVGKSLWQADPPGRGLVELDEDGVVRRRVALGFEPRALAVVRTELLLSEWEAEVWHRIDLEKGIEVATEPGPVNHLGAMTDSGRFLYCARGSEVILVDRSRGLPVCGFSLAPAKGAPCELVGLAVESGRLWYADAAGECIARIPVPEHGKWVAAGAQTRRASFQMAYRNPGTNRLETATVLQHLPFLEMPGQRYIDLKVEPQPKALFRDDLGNVVAWMDLGPLGPGESRRCEVAVTLWSADRRMVLYPGLLDGKPLSVAQQAYLTKFHPIPGEESPEVADFVKDAVGVETNPYWRVRKAHDALCRRIYYKEPVDESVSGVLKNGFGVCRNYSAAMESFGRLIGVPVLNSWAPRHETSFLLLPALGPALMEVTANDSGPDPASSWRRSRWFLGTSADEVTTGVRGFSMHNQVLLDGTPYDYHWHYWSPSGGQPLQAQGFWTVIDPQTGKPRRL